ncbi:MAG: hypothetical protein RL199_1473, partial [Pseudomonadota bacterium]
QRDGLEDQLAALLSDDQKALGESAEIRETSRRIAKEKEKYDLEYGGLVRELEGLEKLREEVGTIVPEDGEQLTRQLEEKRKSAVRFATQFDDAQEKVTSLLAEARELENQSGGVAMPRDVADMRAALEQGGIKHAVIAEMVEVREAEWQTAVESTLGGSRFAVVVDKRDSQKAREIARQKRYRYFITEFEDRPHKGHAPAGSALSVTELARHDLPEWIVDSLARVQLVDDIAAGMKLGKHQTSMTKDGYRQDNRGGLFAGVDRLYCGRSAAGERLRSIKETELPQATAQRDACARERDLAERSVAEFTSRLTKQRKLAEWREKEAMLSLKLARKDELVTLRRGFTDRIVENDAKLTGFDGARNDRAAKRGEFTAKRDQLERERMTLERQLPTQRAKALAELDQLRQMEASLTQEQRSPEALAEVPPREAIESLIGRLAHELEHWTGCRDLAAKEVYDKIKAEYDEFKGFLDARRAEHTRWNDELGLARKAYKRVVEQTVEFYRRAVVRLAEKAGFQIEVPNLALNDDDEALEKAGLVVRVAYDGKHFVNIDDPDLSGGQSVLTSLVLLLGMTFADGTEDSTGFFILDEPFAHLSVERIDDVAAFLSATKSQFILTTPTTHNHNVFNPSHLTVALRKKKGGEAEAPAPVFIRR